MVQRGVHQHLQRHKQILIATPAPPREEEPEGVARQGVGVGDRHRLTLVSAFATRCTSRGLLIREPFFFCGGADDIWEQT